MQREEEETEAVQREEEETEAERREGEATEREALKSDLFMALILQIKFRHIVQYFDAAILFRLDHLACGSHPVDVVY